MRRVWQATVRRVWRATVRRIWRATVRRIWIAQICSFPLESKGGPSDPSHRCPAQRGEGEEEKRRRAGHLGRAHPSVGIRMPSRPHAASPRLASPARTHARTARHAFPVWRVVTTSNSHHQTPILIWPRQSDLDKSHSLTPLQQHRTCNFSNFS